MKKEWVKLPRRQNTGVRWHAMVATVLSKVGSAKEGNGFPGVIMLEPRVDRKDAWEAVGRGASKQRGF